MANLEHYIVLTLLSLMMISFIGIIIAGILLRRGDPELASIGVLLVGTALVGHCAKPGGLEGQFLLVSVTLSALWLGSRVYRDFARVLVDAGFSPRLRKAGEAGVSAVREQGSARGPNERE